MESAKTATSVRAGCFPSIRTLNLTSIQEALHSGNQGFERQVLRMEPTTFMT